MTSFLDSRIAEISYMMATVLMLFVVDYLTDRFVIRRIRKQNVLVRRASSFFTCSSLSLYVPLLTLSTAQLLASLILEPYKRHLIPIMIGFFALGGILLSLKYRMKLF